MREKSQLVIEIRKKKKKNPKYIVSRSEKIVILAVLLASIAGFAQASTDAPSSISTSTSSKPPARVSTVRSPEATGVVVVKPANVSEQAFVLVGQCASFASCKNHQQQQITTKKLVSGCNCDPKCTLYGDCCPLDNPNAQSLAQKISDNVSNERIRKEWHCHRVNSVFGNVLIKASCPADWLANKQSAADDLSARLTQRRCEYAKQRASSASLSASERELDESLDHQTDPVGMMMPITDLTSGITYANSHCLRCNSKFIFNNNNKSFPIESRLPRQPSRLTYWSPLLECNYNLDTDDRNTLYDLISINKGQALHYSIGRKKWVINMERQQQHNVSSKGDDFERVCTITPMIPESVEQSIRFCQLNTISSCKQPKQVPPSSEFLKAKQECEFGNQALVYTETSVYFNPACAKCNHEKRIFCEQPKQRRPPQTPTSLKPKPVEPVSCGQMEPKSGAVDRSKPAFGVLSIPEEDNEPGSGTSYEIPQTGGETLAGFGRSSNGGRVQPNGAPISGSFSVLMDIYSLSSGDEQVGAVHQCPDPEKQVYDPFFLTCRDAVCGLNLQLVDGACVSLTSGERADKWTHANLVEKFKPPMAYLTAIGLFISITSLFIYLILYCLSMFDLRPLVVEMAQAGQKAQMANNPLDKVRESRESGFSNSRGAHQQSGRSQSLASRGVACLAGSLLAAYLLFILGHQNNSTQSSNLGEQSKQLNDGQGQLRASTLSCLALAIATYYCFLVSFNWMFLLSYDIWRTLRLATCRLQAPSLNSQSTRFILYSLFALLSAALVVGSAVVVDQFPAHCSETSGSLEVVAPATSCSSDFDKSELGHFVANYRPKFGQKPNSCWFSNRRALALFFGLPVTLIMILNLIFFLHSSCMVIQTSSKSSLKLKSSSSVHHHHHHQQQQQQQQQHQHSKQQHEPTDTQNNNQPKLMSFVTKLSTRSSSGSSSNAAGADQSCPSSADYAHQNGLTTSSLSSVQTIQSNLSISSASSTSGEHNDDQQHQQHSPVESADGAHSSEPQFQQQTENNQQQAQKRPLEPSQSSSSILTNNSVGGVSISASLAMKYDAHMQNLSFMMNSIVKDYRLYCRLSTIMGLTWLIGLLASIVDHSDALWYLFVVSNTLQGLFIFIAFGCKRSKLTNVEILINYLRFRFSQLSFCCCCWAASNKSDHNDNNDQQDDSDHHNKLGRAKKSKRNKTKQDNNETTENKQ